MIRSTVSTMASARCSAISLGVPAQPTSLWLDGRMNTVHGRVWGCGIGVSLLHEARELRLSRAPDVLDEGWSGQDARRACQAEEDPDHEIDNYTGRAGLPDRGRRRGL